MRLKYCYECMGWDRLLLLNILYNNQILKELGDAIDNLPVHVSQAQNSGHGKDDMLWV